MISFRCPVCFAALKQNGHSLRCEKGHTFDLARSGYVNLIRSQKKNHGDDPEMVRARSRFLDAGYYQPLKRQLIQMIRARQPRSLLDSGCGEGYYTELCESLPQCDCLGVDLSRQALKTAGRRCPHVRFAAASVFALPLPSDCLDLIWSCFAPLALDENARVLRHQGELIVIGPGRDHLMGLKEILYSSPYPNLPAIFDHPRFQIVDTAQLRYDIHLEGAQAIHDLFMMTPYYYKTSLQDKQKLLQRTSLSTPVHFQFTVLKKQD